MRTAQRAELDLETFPSADLRKGSTVNHALLLIEGTCLGTGSINRGVTDAPAIGALDRP